MTLEQYLRLVLTQDAVITALVRDRVYSEWLPQAPVMPAVVYDLVSADEDETFDGPSGVRRFSVVVDCWAQKRVEATALGNAVRACLSGHSGAAGGFLVQGVFFVSERWEFDEETARYRSTIDYEIWSGGA